MDKSEPFKNVENRIFRIRGKRVMLDRDLAEFYEVKTYQLRQRVKKNITRFPKDSMFRLTRQELLRCQAGRPNESVRRSLPYAFTGQGFAMLSTVLNSKRAILVNIQIIRESTGLLR
ncbi:MAG: ORF6N domain-containing protein [Candidatus Omnitrophica bacterium]|nr:ORF6N domain-containing protein [Candidatus Omnitrophota bacterium]